MKDATSFSLVGGLEKYVLRDAPALAPKFALVLKALYDDDVVEEDDLLAWHAAGATGVEPDVHVPTPSDMRAPLLVAAEPFITWLQEAEETESDDEE